MGNSPHRDGDVSRLHPAIRNKVKAIQTQLKKEKIPFEVFEAFRTPERQAVLKAKRPKVTWVGPWGSIHQYGLAVDFVLRIDKKWSWDDKGNEAKYWTRMHELAKEHGMTPLYNKKGQLIEKPHIQLAGVTSSDLRKGQIPDGGDEVWAEYLGDMIDNWRGAERPPPRPALAPERPPLDPERIAEMEALEVQPDQQTPKADDAAGDARFQRLNQFITRWEGGFVNHPDDKGGATNMGITIDTLSNWRGSEATVEDVRNLTRAEADAIFRSKYYTACRCGEMHDRLAMVVYNCAVLSGPARAVEFVQSGFNSLGLTANGQKLEVDGVLGRKTMAVLQQVDPTVLAHAFMDVQDAYLRGLDTFHVFGEGWMNRMASLREFVNTLPQGAGVRPKSAMKISDANVDLEDILDLTSALKRRDPSAVLSVATDALLQFDADDKPGAARRKRLLRLLLEGKTGANVESLLDVDLLSVKTALDGKPPLTPINAAFGETIGRALNGKKSVTGIIGLLVTAILPKHLMSADVVSFLDTNGPALLTIFSLVTGWGMFGKVDKAIRLMGLANQQR